MLSNLKEHVLSMTGHLVLDIASLHAYLLDDTDVSVRLELASKSVTLSNSRHGLGFSQFVLSEQSTPLYVQSLPVQNLRLRYQ